MKQVEIFSSDGGTSNCTPGRVAGIHPNMPPSTQVNSRPHLNSQTDESGINVYEVAKGFFAFTARVYP